VLGGRVLVLVHLDQNERAGIVLVLQDVEPGNPWLLGGFSSVLERCLPESGFGAGLCSDENVDWAVDSSKKCEVGSVRGKCRQKYAHPIEVRH
jgi:hypothetical protein